MVSDFLPTGGSPQVIKRSLIIADFKGDARSDEAQMEPIMSEDQVNAVHSHPTPDLSNDISRGLGGPRVMFEGYFPTAGEYRAWTQFLRDDQITTFSCAFRVPTLEEAYR